jgi:hypothetical protein
VPPAGAKAEAALRKRKDAKQKKILFALAPVLLLLLVWQGPGMLKAFTGGDAAPATSAPAPTTTTAPADPTAPPSTAAPGAQPTDPAAAATLPESDLPVGADSSQLISFDRFIGKDPFKQQISARKIAEAPQAGTTGGGGGTTSSSNPGSSSSSSGGGSSSSGGGSSGGGGGGGSNGGTPVTVDYAVIDTNGDRESVSVGGTFPSEDPLFRLAALTSTKASIGLVSGSFSNGREIVKVAVGDSITLVSQPDGTRYKITIVSVG